MFFRFIFLFFQIRALYVFLTKQIIWLNQIKSCMRKNKNIKSKKIRIGDISISYFSSSPLSKNRKTILFLHGFPFNKNSWRNQVGSLSSVANCIAIDIRGHGNTTSGHGFFSIDVFAKDLIVFIEKLELQSVVLCGISMGGYIALRSYEIKPELLQALILCDTHANADTNTQKQNRFDTIQSILHHGKRPFSIGFITKLFTPESIENNIPEIEMIRSSIRRNGTTSICSTLLALASRTDTYNILKEIQAPCLLIRGKEDRITPYKAMNDMHTQLPNSTFKEIEDAGHLPNLERPKLFNNLMYDFLKTF